MYLKASDGAVFDARVPSLGGDAAQNSLESYGLSFDVLNRLNEHALVIPDYNSFNTYVVVDHSTTDVELHHQGIRWDCDILTDGRKKVPVNLHGVALTVAGRELSRFVSSEPMEGYTEALKEFLRRDFGLRMRSIFGAEDCVLGWKSRRSCPSSRVGRRTVSQGGAAEGGDFV